MRLKNILVSLISLCCIINNSFSQPVFPGTVIAESPTPLTRTYASPSIAILSDGTYVVAHDMTSTESAVYRSTDQGITWSFVTKVKDSHWASLFVHNGELYLMGTAKSFGNIVVHKSLDGGFSWTQATDANTGLLFSGRYHTAPVPVVKHNGRIWRAYEESPDPNNERDFHAFVLSAPENADLLQASSWTKSNIIRFDESWLNARRPNWFEGNIVVTPNGDLVDFMRLETWQAVGGGLSITTGGATGMQRYEVAAKISVSNDGSTVSFNNTSSEYVHFPGAESKFTIRYDTVSGKYWTIVSKISVINSTWETFDLPSHQRNVLALYSSSDLVNWEHKYNIIRWNEGYALKTWDVFGFQYADWQFEGDDIVAVSRTSWYGARYHNANMITFHRIENFRDKEVSDSPADLYPLTQSPTILSWKFSNPDAPGNQSTSNSTYTHANLEVSVLSRGDGLANTAGLLRSFNSTAASPASSLALAISRNQYLQFEVEPKSGFETSIHSIDAKLRRNSAGAVWYKWAYSLDGENFTEIGNYNIPFKSSNSEGEIQSTIHVAGLKELQNLAYPQKATFRLYFWGASSSTGGFAIGRHPSGEDTPSLIIGGEVKAIPPPVPTLVAWEFSALSGETAGAVNATTNNVYINPVVLSRGPGLSVYSLARGYYSKLTSYGAAGSSANSKAAAIANGDYYTFSVKPRANAVLSLSTLDAKLRKNGNGPSIVSWYYSTDGTNFTEITQSANVLAGNSEGDVQPTVDLSGISELQNIDDTKTITFRVYGWGALTDLGGFGIGRYGTGDTTPSLSIGGEITYNGVDLANWNYDLAGKNSPINANIINSNVQQAILSRGAGIAYANNSTLSYVAYFGAGADSLAAHTSGAYFQTVLTLNTTKKVSLSAIKARLRTSDAKSVKNYKWYYSLDNISYYEIYPASNAIGYTNTQGEEQPEVYLKNINALQSLTGNTTVYFRIYAWGADADAEQSQRGFGFGKGENSIESRTVLTFTGTITENEEALPVNQLIFSGKAQGGKVELTWSTASENNNSHFEILHGREDEQFEKLGKVNGSGVSTEKKYYQYIDENPWAGTNYYQLKQVDFDGTSKITETIAVDVFSSGGQNAMNVFSSLQKDNTSIYFNVPVQKGDILKIYNTGGVLLHQQNIKDTEEKGVHIPFNRALGVYVAVLATTKGEVYKTKFIRQ